MIALENSSGKRLAFIGYHTIDGPICFIPHHHASLELSCVVRGTATYQVNDEDYDMRPGDIFLFAPTDHHNLKLCNEKLEHIVIHIDPAFIWNALGNDMDYQFLMVFFSRSKDFRCRLDRDNPAAPMLAQLFREIWEESREKHDCYELMIKIKLQLILAQIIRHYHCIDDSQTVQTLHPNDLELMNRVLGYIDEHLGDDIRLPELAEIAHVSVSHFSSMFRRCNGLPPMEYVVARRVQRAIECIRTGDTPLSEIAAQCGFNNNTNFYKAFRRVTGRTPASYRQATDAEAHGEMPTVTAEDREFRAPETEKPAPPVPPTPVYTRPETPKDPCGGDMCDPCRLCSYP